MTKPTVREVIEFEVPLVPPTINVLMRKHWSYRRNQKGLWACEIMAALSDPGEYLDARIMKHANTHGYRKLRIEITVHHNREFDQDNLASIGKIPLDALKQLGIIVDDSSQYVEFAAKQVKSKTVKTVFRITLA